MPQMKKMATPPPEPKKKSSVSVNKPKKDPALRKRAITADIYGDELLKPSIKLEKEIVICFHPFTKNDLRISTNGKFVIERFSVEEFNESEDNLLPTMTSHWNLFYFKSPIDDFTPPATIDEFKKVTYELKDSNCYKFLDFNSVEELSAKVMELIKKEYFEETQAMIEAQQELDKAYWKDYIECKENEENEVEEVGSEE